MSETPINPGLGAAPPAPAAQPAAAQTARQDQQANPRSRGTSPARDAREAAAGAQQTEPAIKIGDQEYPAETVRDAIARKIESDTLKAALPASADKYEVKLPANWKAPEGIQVEFAANDPLIAQARQAAHEEGLTQNQFSKMLGIFAASRVGELQTVNAARQAELAKLGSAADQRLTAIDTWLKARVGNKGDVLIKTLRHYPVASMVEALEGIVGLFSNQGGAQFSQSHREQQTEPGKIPGYENMNFMQRRSAQDQVNTRNSGPTQR